jgi:cell division protein FtsB
MKLTKRADERPPENSAPRRLGLATAILALLTAGFGVLSAYLGVQTAQLSKDQKQSELAAQSAGAQASTVQNQNQQLQQTNTQLQQENNQLRSQLGDWNRSTNPVAETSSQVTALANASIGSVVSIRLLGAPTASTIPGQEPTVRHAGKVVIAAGGPGINLDAPSSDPQWGTTGASDGNVEIGYSNRTTIVGWTKRYLPLGTAKADYEACSTRTGYINIGGTYITDVSAGTSFCFQTDERRYSAVKILSIDNASATLDIVTYDPPIS